MVRLVFGCAGVLLAVAGREDVRDTAMLCGELLQHMTLLKSAIKKPRSNERGLGAGGGTSALLRPYPTNSSLDCLVLRTNCLRNFLHIQVPILKQKGHTLCVCPLLGAGGGT